MIKVIIADTDKNNYRNYKTYIHASHPDFQVVGNATNENEVYTLLKKHDARLIISDMRLTDITGYQLFKNISNDAPSVKMILYISFNELEYGKRALEDGLINYMIKPVKPTDLEKCLCQVAEIFEELEQKEKAHQWLIAQYEQKLPVFEDRFLINLVHGHMEDEYEILRNIAYFDMPLSKGYTALIVKVDYYNKIALALDEREKQIFIFSILYSIKEILDELKNGIAFINHPSSIAIILGNNLQLDNLISIGETIRDKIKNTENTTVTIGIGKTYQNAKEIRISYLQAKSALRYKYRMGIGSIIPINYVEPYNNITYRYPLKKEELLVYSVVVGDYETSNKLLKEIFEALKDCGKLPEKLLPKIILDILVSINRYASEKKIPINEAFSKTFSTSLISDKNTLEDAYEYLRKTIEDLCDHINGDRRDHDTKIFELAKKYAETYYFEPISLTKTAIFTETTPEYLNEIFVNKAGKTFYDYSVEIRVEKAKYFILETNLNDREIAKKVGYEDARHFSRVFYKYENESLESFRNKNKE